LLPRLTLAAALTLAAFAQTGDKMLSSRAAGDPALSTDPDSPLWRTAPPVVSETSARGEPTPGHRTEFRSRWTSTHLYFLFVCPYEQFYLKPGAPAQGETNKLWDYDVAEIFIGADFEKIWQYREFQVSPRGEWVDLDIDRREPKPEGGWLWNSGYAVAARIDEAKKIWYGAMKIPIASITARPVGPGFEFRCNLFRLQGPPPRKSVAWRKSSPTGNHHVPEAFGILRLEN
jgi:hypothetical protein